MYLREMSQARCNATKLLAVIFTQLLSIEHVILTNCVYANTCTVGITIFESMVYNGVLISFEIFNYTFQWLIYRIM